MKAKTATEVLIAAKWMIENVGWIQGAYVRTDADRKPNAFCLAGALQYVESESNVIREHAYALISRQTPDGSYIKFNDSPKRTKQEVVALLDRAINDSKKDES
jgi:hypothetical protein